MCIRDSYYIPRGVKYIFNSNNWGTGGQTIEITPVFFTSQYSLTVGSSDENKGTVSATVVETDIYELRATACLLYTSRCV